MLPVKKLLRCFLISIICLSHFLTAIGQGSNTLQVDTFSLPTYFPLFDGQQAAPIFLDASDARVVTIAAMALSEDVKSVCGHNISIRNNILLKDIPSNAIIAGTAGQSILIDELIRLGKIEGESIRGKWEQCMITTIDDPFNRGGIWFVVAGSNPRGTAYGIFELSRQIGVSPWYWWADVPVEKKPRLYIKPGTLVIGSPSVKYRGIFLNDEDWGLQPWAAQIMDTDIKDIGPKTYKRIFELLLRLKANLIWPAMHPCTKAFFSYPGNAQAAADYAIVVGTSHAEPMLRNNVGEWNEKTMGPFDYTKNKDSIYRYWDKRVAETKGLEAIYTVGMRGVHDSGMKGVKDEKEAAVLLESIIKDQRKILAEHKQKDVTKVPQAFTTYKEVLDIYDHGMEVPEDITLVWPDDNYGYIHRLSNPLEQQRKGGSGVYYHASYWGRPHDYLWLSSTHPLLIRMEMMKAFAMQAREIWVLNVGDIKPLEYNIQLFLDMAWNAEPFEKSGYVQQHMAKWYASIFGQDVAGKIVPLMLEYNDLAFERRPEFMGWSQTEPTTKVSMTAYNHLAWRDEAQRRIDRYSKLEQQANELFASTTAMQKDAFFQLVYYPLVCASHINKKFLHRDKAIMMAKTNPAEAEKFRTFSLAAHEAILKETYMYNTQLAGGKWNGMMSASPRSLPVFNKPDFPDTTVNTFAPPASDQISSKQVAKPKGYKGAEVKDGFLSIPAGKYSRKVDQGQRKWDIQDLPSHSGRPLISMPLNQALIHDLEVEKQQLPFAEYEFFAGQGGSPTVSVFTLPTHPLTNEYKLRYAISIDEGPLKVVDFSTFGRSEEWKQHVLSNRAARSVKAGDLKAGKHKLRIYAIDPAVVLDYIEISYGNTLHHYSMVPPALDQ